MDQFFNVSGQLLEGFGENCIIFIVTLLAAIPLGLIISMGSMSKFKPLKWLTKTFVWIIRGTPLMLQLFVVFYVPPLVSNGSVTFARMNAALIAFIIRNLPWRYRVCSKGTVRGRSGAWHDKGSDFL